MVFGEAKYLDDSAGKCAGEIKFTDGGWDDSADIWDNRLSYEHAEPKVDGGDKYPAKLGFRAAVGCSARCWQAEGIQRYVDFPAAVLAAAALAAAARSLGDQEVPDLSALARDLEADDAKRSKIAKRALTWVSAARCGETDLSQVCRVAREMLEPLEA